MAFANNFSLSLQKYFRVSLALIMRKSYMYAFKTDIQTNRVFIWVSIPDELSILSFVSKSQLWFVEYHKGLDGRKPDCCIRTAKLQTSLRI